MWFIATKESLPERHYLCLASPRHILLKESSIQEYQAANCPQLVVRPHPRLTLRHIKIESSAWYGAVSRIMNQTFLLLLGVGFCLSTITYLALSQKQRAIFFSRLRIRGRKTSCATTPPRSLSPEKKVPNNVSSSTDYVDSFPPSQRATLAKVGETLPPERRRKLGGEGVDPTVFARSLMPFTSNYVECEESKYTPTAFSVEEIKALGNFPDYAELSGVPLPEPYVDFDIEKALPRPYRPFRWAYHQTMCMPFGFSNRKSTEADPMHSTYQT